MNNDNIVISIIIPVYNVEKYLNRCLDSILSQKTNFQYEIIAVDDCSTDTSTCILETYAKKYDFFKIIKHERNLSLSIARKTGFKVAKGDFIMNIDSDDWIESNSLQKIYNIISDDNSDIVVFNYIVDDSFNSRKEIKITNSIKSINDKDSFHPLFLGAPWNKIVRRELLINILYGELGINNGEDLVYSTEIFLKANKISINQYSFYVYFKNLSSLTRMIESEKFLSNQILVLKQLTEIFDKYSPSEKKIKLILKYFIKFIFIELYKYHFNNNKQNKNKILYCLTELNNNSYLNNYFHNQIIASIQHKHKLLFNLLKYVGLKKTSILLIKTILYE